MKMNGGFADVSGGAAPARAKTAFELVNGCLFDPVNPDEDLMTPEAIATALSNNCRFGGQVREFYSIAQHSVHVAVLAPKDMAAQRAAIMHDADEAFGLPDMISPVKPCFPEFVKAQGVQGTLIQRRYGFTHDDHVRIKPADRAALIEEKKRLKSRRNEIYWQAWTPDAEIVHEVEIDPLLPYEARELFEAAYERVFEQGLPITAEWLLGQKGFLPIAEPRPEF